MTLDRKRRESGFNALYNAHYGAVRAFAWRREPALADDIVAETFLVAWRRLEGIPGEAPLPWLLAASRNVHLNMRRSQRRRRQREVREAVRASAVEGSPAWEQLPEEEACIWDLLERLGATSHAALAKGLAQKQAAWQAAHPGQALPSTAPATGVPAPLAALQAPLQAADITRVGQTVLRGQQVLVLADSEPSMHRRYYVDPQTYLPIRMLERPDGLGLVTIDYGWLPAAAQATCWFTLPSGAREVSVSQFPVHD